MKKRPTGDDRHPWVKSKKKKGKKNEKSPNVF